VSRRGSYLALAPAKVNLGLYVGPRRESDGRHELVTVMQSISLADELRLDVGADGVERDEVICPGLPEPAQENLAARALALFREATGWAPPPLRLSIAKRIPVAAGLGGGSADAACALRLALLASGLGDERLLIELAAELGADVSAQVAPGRWLATGAGELLEALADPFPALELLVLPAEAGLSTADVYEEADALGLQRERAELRQRREQLRSALELGAPLPAQRGLLHNDLQAPATSLSPAIAGARERMREAGAEETLISGSGPTVVGLFAHANPGGRAQRAAAAMRGRSPEPIAAKSVAAAFARAVALG
jgi:4-diphosphocytidyl-2-C-methyl-D-erythritol kinase